MTTNPVLAGRRFRRGFSLIEVMVALAVIAIALFSMLTMMLNTMNLKEVQRQRALAKQAALAKLEEIKAQDFDTINPQYGAGGFMNTFTVDGLLDSAQGDSQARGAIAIDNTNPDLLDLTVTITWEALGGQNLNYSTRSLYSR